MCGIAGYKALQSGLLGAKESVHQEVSDCLMHRGPQGQGIWTDASGQCTFIHRRLKIVDLSEAGYQPMFDPQRQIAIVYNGEIYNHRQIRAELEQLGYAYRSQTDTETIIYAYQQWGIDCIKKFKGMFAFALFDMRTQDLFLVRDHIGIKPLYFSLQGGYCSFASEIKALFCLPWITKNIRLQSVMHYLTFLVTPAPLTLYEGIYKIPAGHYIHINKQNNMQIVRWYSPVRLLAQHGYSTASEEEHVARLQTMLRDSVEAQTMADVPYGVFLSGGIDSSLITALLSSGRAQPGVAYERSRVKTFTIASTDGPEYNEIKWARQVAAHFNTDHYEIEIDEKDAFRFFDTMVYYQDEPLADCVCIPLYYVSHLLKKSGVTVVQVGEGSDELFCGYQSYAQYLTMHPYYTAAQKLPRLFKKGVYQVTKEFLQPTSSRSQILHSWTNDRHFFWSGAFGFSDTAKQELMTSMVVENDEVVQQIWPTIAQTDDSYDWITHHLRTLYEQVPHAEFFTSMIYLEFMNRLPELLLMRVDKMSMISSVEARVPFLDHELVEYAFTIPAAYKYRNRITKYILKKAARGILPDYVIDRPKMGFAAPTKRWFKTGDYFKGAFVDTLVRQDIWSEIFDKKAIATLFDYHQQPNVDCSLQLWILYNLMSVRA